MILIALLIAVCIAFCITFPFIVIFHELGHALAYLILTKPDRVDIFIGSQGNGNVPIKFNIGKLQFHIKPSFFLLGGGQCVSTKSEDNYLYKIIILLAGSVFTFFIACVIGYIIMNTDLHGIIKMYFFMLMITSFMSLFINLKPHTNSKTGLANDGMQLVFTYKVRKVYREYINALYDIANADYQSGKIKMDAVLSVVPNEVSVMRYYILSAMMTRNYDDAEKQLLKLEKWSELSVTDQLHLGYIQSITNRSEEAVRNYQEALNIEPNNLVALNNLGYEQILKGNYKHAQDLLEKALYLDPEFADGYANLGLIKVFNNNLIEGKVLIDKSLEIMPDNAYTHKTLGIYYLNLKDKEAAAACFNKAAELDRYINLEPYKTELSLL